MAHSYSKDISMKTKSGMLAKMKRGEYLNSTAPYGYIKSVKYKNRLEIDPEAADVVRFIFDLTLQGKSQAEIARTLNAKGISSPSEYMALNGRGRHRKNTSKDKDPIIWSGSKVQRIIRDERYTGTMVTRKSERMVVGNPQSIKYLPSDEWVRVPNTHEAIIHKAIFDDAQSRFKKTTLPQQKKEKPIFTSIVRCHHCNKALNRNAWGGKRSVYFCPTPYRIESPDCFSGRILEQTIYDAAIATIKAHIATLVELQKQNQADPDCTSNQITKLNDEIKQIRHDLDMLKKQKKSLYETYNDSRISKKDYFDNRRQLDEEIAKVATALDELQSELQSKTHELEQSAGFSVEDSPWAKAIGIKELTRPLVEELVEAIVVYDTERLEIRLNYSKGHVTQI